MSNQDGTRSDRWQFSVVRLKRCQEILKARGPAVADPWCVEAMRTLEKVGESEKNIQNTVLTCCVQKTVTGSTKDLRHMTTKSSSVFYFPRQHLSKTWFSHQVMDIGSTLYMKNLNFPKKTQ